MPDRGGKDGSLDSMAGELRDSKRRLDVDVLGRVLEEDEADAVDSQPVPHDTVRPSFDVQRFAEDSVMRERLPTITDEVATEEARIASVLMDSVPPRAPMGGGPDVQVAVRYSEVEALGDEEQLAFLRARLAPMSRVPALARKITELGPVIEDPKTAYILGFIDGVLPLETIVEVAGLPELDTLRILDRAIDQYLISFRPRLGSKPSGT
jgi:hypothetical protein